MLTSKTDSDVDVHWRVRLQTISETSHEDSPKKDSFIWIIVLHVENMKGFGTGTRTVFGKLRMGSLQLTDNGLSFALTE